MSTSLRMLTAALPWLASALLLLALHVTELLDARRTLALLGVLGLVHCVYGFWSHGQAHISAPGIYLLGTGLFVFFPSIYIAQFGASFDDAYVLAGTGVAYFAQVLMYHGWWDTRRLDRGSPPNMAPEVANFAFSTGAVLVVIGVACKLLFGFGSPTLAGAAAFLGIVLMSVGATFAFKVSKLRVASIAVAGSLYIITMFTGGGRLVVASLALAIVLVVNLRFPGRWLKTATLVAVPLGLVLMASYRADVVLSREGVSETGLESVVWPLERFSQLLGMALEGDLPLAWGRTFLVTLIVFIPRVLWEGKPIGFGAELTPMFRPELVKKGHSEAALFYGEWVYNFGVIAVLLMIPATAWLILAIDRMYARQAARPMLSRSGLFFTVGTVLIAAGLLDLVWVGTFTYVARTGMRLLVLGLLFVIFTWKTKPYMPALRRAFTRLGGTSARAQKTSLP